MGQAAPTAARRTRLGRQVPWKSQRCPRAALTSLWTAPTLNGRNCSQAPSTIHCARAALRHQVVENSALLSPSPDSLHAAPANCRCTPLRASFKIADGTPDKCFFTGSRCHVVGRGPKSHFEARCSGCGSHLGHTFFGEGHTSSNERH